jgi:ubiquinol-cytochrome c reductase cytochrome c subunit
MKNAKRVTSHEPRATIALLAFACALAAMATTALAQVPVLAPAGNAENGKKLFASDGCYQCHGYQAQGATPTGPRLGPRPLAFAAFSKYVRQPTGQMPPYTTKVVTDAALSDIYAFLQSLPAPPPADSLPLLK